MVLLYLNRFLLFRLRCRPLVLVQVDLLFVNVIALLMLVLVFLLLRVMLFWRLLLVLRRSLLLSLGLILP